MRRQQRTTLILAAIAAALFAFIWFYERNTLSSKELSERHGKVLDRFVKARLSKIEIQRHGETYVIERRRPDDDENGEGPFWGLTSPMRADCDDDAVSSLLGELEFMEARRTLEGIGDAERHRMGLDHPRVRLWMTVAGERQLLAVGGEDARDEGVFVATGDRSRAFVVGKDVFEALDKEGNDFRDKRLFGGANSIRVADRLSIHGGPDGTLSLARDGTRWSFTDSQAGWASREALEGILGALDELRASRFEHERTSPEILARTQLDHSAYDVVARVPPSFSEQAPDGGAGEAGVAHPHTFRLRLGAPCVGHVGERYAIATRDSVDGPVVCIASTDLELLLAVPAASLRDARVVTTENDAVDHLGVAAGSHRLDVRREGDGFRYTVDGAHDEQGASQTGVARWLDALRTLRATEYVALATDPHGTDHGRASLTISGEEGTDAETVVLGASDASGAWLRRGNEPVALHVGPEAAEMFAPTPIVIRDPQVVHDDAATYATIIVTRQSAPLVALELHGEDWTATAPPHTTANQTGIHALLRLMTTLEAVRWAAPHAAPRMGLDTPRAIVVLRTAGVHDTFSRVLHVGAPTAGGSYAVVDADPAVFVVPDSLITALDALVDGVDAGTAPAPP